MSLGLICGSVLLNFRMAYRAADTDFDGWLYGVSIGLADALKALMPFIVARALAHRNWLAVAAGACFFMLMSTYSFTAAVGFAAQHRMTKTTERAGTAERYHDLRQRYQALQEARQNLGSQRAATIIREERAALLLKPVPGRRTVGDASANCTLNRSEVRASCEEWRRLGVELASAMEAERIDTDLRELRSELDTIPAVQNGQDPQTVAISRLSQWFAKAFSVEDIQLGLSILLALVVETGSGFGLYLASDLLRRHHEGEGRGVMADAPKRLGMVDDYALARLVPALGATMTGSTLYADYVVWCARAGFVALSRAPFLEQFGGLAAELGLRIEHVAGDAVFQDVQATEGG
jgi:hypothetical protein